MMLKSRSLDFWKQTAQELALRGDYREALVCCKRGLHFESNAELLKGAYACHLGLLEFEDGILILEQLLAIPGQQPEWFANLGDLYCYIGEVAKGISWYEQAISRATGTADYHRYVSKRLFALHYLPSISPERIFQEHAKWGETFSLVVPTIHYTNQPVADKQLKIGYLSPDFTYHAVLFFIQPVLAHHDQQQFSIYCYANVAVPDQATAQLRERHPVVWRDISRLTDAEAADLISHDGIDILVELAGHTQANRLPLLALKPAPVQVTWIGYPDSTGIRAIDYRITDSKADPSGNADLLHTEKLLRLPRTFLCYRPGTDFPAVSSSPFLSNGHITFGCLCSWSKVTPQIISLWGQILAGTPGSRLLLRARGVKADSIHGKLRAVMEELGVAQERIEVMPVARSIVGNISEYARIDIALDTSPYNGTTTTCEALYMGVPVITLHGDCHMARVGVSLLETVGLGQLVAESQEQYCSLAIGLAAEYKSLEGLRSVLRTALLHSPLCDASGFTKNLEQAFRGVWGEWCKRA
jgi:protein O-GlcNAc transferase